MKPVKRCLLITGMIVLLALDALSQKDSTVVEAMVNEGDTIPVVNLREVLVVSWGNLSRRQEKQLTRLMRNVKIVYPFAKLAGIKYFEYEDLLLNAETKRERRQIVKQMQDEIETEYGQDLRDLTFTQGHILLKLIDREIGESSYDLVADLKSQFAAVFYQAIARLFTYDLKVRYDPEGEDRDIELIIEMIENGII